ncbi:hypothetical protein FO519_009085 [Halicephalobus sp. NKZ332]|nr:hypothetical protein FO519_009085 [Halicephalobus sp. NKZ332]
MADEKANLKARILLDEASCLTEIPDDFLRLPASIPSSSQDPGVDPRMVLNGIPYHAVRQVYIPPNTRGRLQIKLTSARLTKNYGFVRMDPYVRVRVGNVVYETPTNTNGGKNPQWNCNLETYLPVNVESIYLQIFDERSFTDDECIAWSRITLPLAIFNGEAIDEWYPLSGRQGEAQEGVINLIMSFREIDPATLQRQQELVDQVDPELAAAIEASKQEIQQGPVEIKDEDVSEIAAMFPNVDADVIKAILEDKRGNKEATVTALIELSSE